MSRFDIRLPESYHELNTPARGYLEHVLVQLPDGRTYSLTFLDPYNKERYSFYFEGQTVFVIEEVSEENIHKKVKELIEINAFELLKSINE